MIHLRRDPIDTCLSCYFQQFPPGMNYTMDLSDLAHYYREHQRLMAHWRAVLPQESLLEVPYAELVTDQETWTRRILEFIGLPWDARCLEFHKTARRGDHRQHLAGAAEDLQELGRALAQLREIHRPPARAERAGLSRRDSRWKALARLAGARAIFAIFGGRRMRRSPLNGLAFVPTNRTPT